MSSIQVVLTHGNDSVPNDEMIMNLHIISNQPITYVCV